MKLNTTSKFLNSFIFLTLKVMPWAEKLLSVVFGVTICGSGDKWR
jgi:hypothetical protein